MIRQGNPTLFLKPLGNGFYFFARQAINNTGIVGVMFLDKLPKLLFGLSRFSNRIKNIGPVKTIQINIGLLQIELFNDFLTRTFIGCSCEGDTRHIRK